MKLKCLDLKTPIILGSCDLFVEESTIRNYVTDCVGAVVLKTATEQPTRGYTMPHVAKFGDGVLVASGMANPGIKEMCKIAKNLTDIRTIGSLIDPNLATQYESAGVIAIELNLSCPHFPGGQVPAHKPELVAKAVSAAKRACRIPVFAKLTGWGCDIVRTTQAAEEAGADAVVVSNLFPGTGYYTGLVKYEHKYKVGDTLLGHGFGAYTSRNFLASVLFLIKQIRGNSQIPIIATGGCCSDADALAQTHLAGASAVETVTPLYLGKNLDSIYNEYLNWKHNNA